MKFSPVSIGLLPLLLAGCAAAPGKIAYMNSPYGSEGLHVSGTAVIRTKPDYALVTLGYTCSAPGARSARETNKNKSLSILKGILKTGVSAEDIHTIEYGMDSQSVQVTDKKTIVVWRVTNKYEIRVRNVDAVADVIDAGTDAGANQIGGVRYAVENLHEARAKARTEACRVAREKAEQLAKELGGKISKVVSIQDSNSRGYWWDGRNAQVTMNSVMNSRDGISSPVATGVADREISAGQVVIEAFEDVTYELK